MKLFNENIDKSTNNITELKQPEFLTCSECGKEILKELVHSNLSTCVYCGYLFRVPAKKRIEMIADEKTFVEIGRDMESTDPLDFPDYKDKLKKAKRATGLNEAIVCGTCKIGGYRTGLAVMDSYFMMGSMGQIVGEKITDIAEVCLEKKLPLIIFCASGGARMQEGIISLLQMSRTTVAMNKLHDAGLLYVSVLTNPTTGGVTASFAMQGDIILAEPKALVGFAGPRVIKQTVKDDLPEEFQTAEFLLQHGMIDKIVERKDMRTTLAQILSLH
ncbi:MAG: acetyl-CoA carboxylase, carboxyltransferase subunit beta [Eubacteriales bacterium]